MSYITFVAGDLLATFKRHMAPVIGRYPLSLLGRDLLALFQTLIKRQFLAQSWLLV